MHAKHAKRRFAKIVKAPPKGSPRGLAHEALKYLAEVYRIEGEIREESQPQHDSQWAAIVSIAAKIGCTAETLRRWVRQHETNTGQRPGLSTQEQQRIKELEREVRELRQANEILRKASAYFAQAELDRRFKP